MLLFLAYLGLNALCLKLSADPDIGRGAGSLAAYNAMLLVLPATRNSVLTLLLGLPFDHVVVYHRFFGRFTMLCVVVHFGYFFDRFINGGLSDQVYVTGFVAFVSLICCCFELPCPLKKL